MLAALTFLTVFGRSTTPTPRSVQAFPVVGALIGGVVGAAWWGAGYLWPPLVAAMIAVVVDLAVTGMLHLDGLSDSADGLLAPMDRARRLAVMRDPAVGAFGAIALIAVLGLRVAALASMAAAPWAIAGVWCLSRTAMVAVTGMMPYARSEGGLVTAFGGGSARHRWLPLICGVVLAAALAALDLGWWTAVVLAAGALGSALVATLARARLGGFTGDILGAAGVVGETFALMAMVAL